LGRASHSPAARGLRAHARVKEGKKLTVANQITYDNWKAMLDAKGLVVMFDPAMGPNDASSAGLLYYAKRRPDTPDDEYFQYPVKGSE
jgi:hypothetical protein